MSLQTYLTTIGLSPLIPHSENTNPNTFVQESFSKTKSDFSPEEIKSLYVYQVPELGPDGSCSTSKHPTKELYNLAPLHGLEYDFALLKNHPQTLFLWRLRQVVTKIQELTGVDWFGIYKKVKNLEGQEILLKESYYGEFSRPEFPLTEEFAKGSNNSTVGLTGKAILVQDVSAYAGPYYQCDGKVQSEFCLPILGDTGRVLGIIDAESFPKNFFTEEKLLQIVKVALDLGNVLA